MLLEMDCGTKTVTDSKLFSTANLLRNTFLKTTNFIALNFIFTVDMVRTVYTSSDKVNLTHMDLKSTTSNLSERAVMDGKTTSETVILSQATN